MDNQDIKWRDATKETALPNSALLVAIDFYGGFGFCPAEYKPDYKYNGGYYLHDEYYSAFPCAITHFAYVIDPNQNG